MALAGAILAIAASPAFALPVRFAPPQDIAIEAPVAITVGQLNRDADPDLAVATDTDTLTRLLGGAAPLFGNRGIVAVGSSPRAVAAGNLNPFLGGPISGSDVDVDLVVANSGSDSISVLAGTGSGGFARLLPDLFVGDNPRGIAVGRFDAGVDPDLAVTTSGLDRVQILRGLPPSAGNPGERVALVTSAATGNSPHGIASGDFDRDGEPDLATANLLSDNVTILRGSTNLGFVGAGSVAAGDGARSIATGDFNRDGDLDLAVANEFSDDVSVLLGIADARFAPAMSFATGDAPYGVVARDFTRDGDLDLAVADSGVGTVSVLVGRPGGGFAAPVAVAVGGAPVAIDSGDFDADGESDVAIANATDEVSVLLNTTPPDTVITAGPLGRTADATPAFAFSADEAGAAFSCRIDTAAPAPCRSPFTTSRLSDGPHTIRVAAVDPAGNVDPTPAARTFAVAATPPETRIDSGPRKRTSDFEPTFTFSANHPGSTFACRVDRARFAPCTSPHTLGLLKPGRHVLRVRATDSVGNVDPTPATRSFLAVPDRLTSAELDRAFSAFANPDHIRVDRLRVLGAKRGMRIVARCRGGRRLGCPGRLARRAVTIRVRRRGRVGLERLFRRARLRAGAVLDVRIHEPRAKSRVVVFTIRDRTVVFRLRCLTPGLPRRDRCRI